MMLQAKAQNCFSSTFVLKINDKAIGKFEGRFFDVGQDDLHALLRAAFGQRAADAAGCSCHDGDFSLECFHDGFLFRSFYVNAEQSRAPWLGQTGSPVRAHTNRYQGWDEPREGAPPHQWPV